MSSAAATTQKVAVTATVVSTKKFSQHLGPDLKLSDCVDGYDSLALARFVLALDFGALANFAVQSFALVVGLAGLNRPKQKSRRDSEISWSVGAAGGY